MLGLGLELGLRVSVLGVTIASLIVVVVFGVGDLDYADELE